MSESDTPESLLRAVMEQIDAENPPLIALFKQILETLKLILHFQVRQLFLPLEYSDGVHFVNLAQATQIVRLSDEECEIKLADGQSLTVSGNAAVNAVIRAIRKEVVSVASLSKAPQPQEESKTSKPGPTLVPPQEPR